MRAAIAEARQGALAGEVPVGAVLADGGGVIAAAHNRSIADHDPSAHAEILALRAAGVVRRNHRLTDATLYVTLEPCAMCFAALAEARIARLVFGAYDDKAGAAGSALDLSDALSHRFEINGGVLADDCALLLRDFFAARR
ncbi:MAG: tRNA adenosine(34) deaminase TadA [Woeseiaceae bacterium]|nr:tRNA adenosine(34) deaminase TadA [Woeseiaceae bacterium]